MPLESTAIQLFVQQIVQVNSKALPKLHMIGPLRGESTGEKWFSITNGK